MLILLTNSFESLYTQNILHDFCCLNCLHSFRTENKLKSHEKAYKVKDFCIIEMPSEKNKILKPNQQTKSEKIPKAIYADIKYLVKKINSCENNPQISSTKIGEHITCGYLLSVIWRFDHIENKQSLYHGKVF